MWLCPLPPADWFKGRPQADPMQWEPSHGFLDRDWKRVETDFFILVAEVVKIQNLGALCNHFSDYIDWNIRSKCSSGKKRGAVKLREAQREDRESGGIWVSDSISFVRPNCVLVHGTQKRPMGSRNAWSKRSMGSKSPLFFIINPSLGLN